MLFQHEKQKWILQIGITVSCNFASLRDFGHPLISVPGPETLLPAYLRYKFLLFQCLPKRKLVNQLKKPRSPMKG